MVKKKHKKDSTKRFGTRYGRKLKEKVSEIEKEHRGRHKCPYCNKIGLKRLVAGIWFCNSCNVKFASGAYSIHKKVVIKNKVKEEDKILKAPVKKKKKIEDDEDLDENNNSKSDDNKEEEKENKGEEL
jgi:large subunit ribosomal protein L37Ae